MAGLLQIGRSLADAAEQVLLENDRGPISLSTLIDGLGLDQSPHAPLLAAEHQVAQVLLEDDRRRTAQGKRPRFVVEDNESVRLRTLATSAEDAVAQWNERVKRDLLAQLLACEPDEFEEIVGELIRAMGYGDVRVTQRSRDGGVDITATFSAGGAARVSTAFQVKRSSGTVGRPVVQKLRGAVGSTQQGVIVTTGQFTADAVADAQRQDGLAIHLIDGSQLVDLMVEHGLGVRTSRLVVFALREEFFIGSPDGTPGADATYDVRAAVAHANRRYYLAQLPGGRSADYLATLAQMAQLADKRPSLDAFITLFQEAFPSITRADEARRRMRVLISIGLVEIDSDRVTLTFLGKRFLENRNPEILREAFLTRIAGVSEILALVRGVSTDRERKARLRETPPAGLSTTQAELVLRWLTRLGLTA